MNTKENTLIVRIDKTMNDGLKRLCKGSRRSVSDYVRCLIEDAIKEDKKI